MICGYEIVYLLRCEALHGLFSLLWCLPLLLVCYLTLTTYSIGYLAGGNRVDTSWAILKLLGISCLVVGLSFLSHVFADIYGLGF